MESRDRKLIFEVNKEKKVREKKMGGGDIHHARKDIGKGRGERGQLVVLCETLRFL